MNNMPREQRGSLHQSTDGRRNRSTAAPLHLVESAIGRLQETLVPSMRLENPRTPRPTGDVALQERSEIFGDSWKFPARESDLRKLK